MQAACIEKRAGFWVRLAAYALDRLILAAALVLVKVPVFFASFRGGFWSAPVFFSFTAADILCWLLISAYFVALTACCGATLGKKAMRLRVVRQDTGEKPRFLTVLYRETVGRYLSGILCIGYILIAADSEKRSLHDRICDTLVVYDESVPARKQPEIKKREPVIVPVEDPVKDWYKPYRM